MKPPYCETCPLYTAPGPVAGYGPSDADLFFVGEAPGFDEVSISKRPFTGPSGKLLTSLCISTGYDRRRAFASNVVRCRPTTVSPLTGKLVDRPPTEEEIRHCAPFLKGELEVVKPNLVVALGATALYVFKDNNQISKHRGVPFTTGSGQKVLATYHPAALMRQQHMFPAAYFDLRRAKEESTFPQLRVHPIVYTRSGVVRDLAAPILAAARQAGYVVFDLETLGFDGTYNGALSPYTGDIDLIGFGTEPYSATCFHWSEEVARLTAALFADPTIEKVGQNSEAFDIPFLYGKDIPWPTGPTADTLLMFHLVNPDLPKDLATISTFFTDMPYWKHEAKHGDKNIYNCKDVDATTRAYLALKKEMSQLGLTDLYYKNVMPLQPVLRAMSRRGIKKDEYKASVYAMSLRDIANSKEQMLQRAMGSTFNVNSPKQLCKLFYEDLGLPKQFVKRANGSFGLTVNDEAMETLARVSNDPIFTVVNEIRTARKWASTYCELEADENGFIHPSFGSAKAANGRLNSYEPNAQNIPADMRVLWIPDSPDHVMISSDWNQVELRNALCLAADRTGLEALRDGVDTHKLTAAEGYGLEYEDVDDKMRHAAKFIVYGLMYGRGAKDIAVQLNQTEGWVKVFISKFFKKFAGLFRHRQFQENFVANNYYLRNPWGRRRWWYTKGNAPEIFNFLPSSTAADMMYLVLPKIDRELPKDASLRLTVHDEVVVVAAKDVAREAAECIQENMNRQWPEVVAHSLYPDVVKEIFPGGWSIPADISFAENNWAECKAKTPEAKITQAALQKKLGIRSHA